MEATVSKALGLKQYPSASPPQDRESQVQAVRSPSTPPAEAEAYGYIIELLLGENSKNLLNGELFRLSYEVKS